MEKQRSSNHVAGDLPSLADFAQDQSGPAGPWRKGWYAATVVEEYPTRSGRVFTTSDEPSKDGSSRNLRLCLRVRNVAGQERTIHQVFNYRLTDFTTERLALVKQARSEFNGVRGRWSDTDIQRSSLAVAKLGMLEKAAGCHLKRTQEGTLVPEVFIGKAVDVYFNVDARGFNDATAFVLAGTKVTHNSNAKAKNRRVTR